MLSKVEVSDLKVHIDHLVRTKMEEQIAIVRRENAEGTLNRFLWAISVENKHVIGVITKENEDGKA